MGNKMTQCTANHTKNYRMSTWLANSQLNLQE